MKCEVQTSSTVIVTEGEDGKSNSRMPPGDKTQCIHEKAETQIFVYAKNSTVDGSKALIIYANVTDVLVIAVSVLPTLQQLGIEKMWIAFGK